MDYAWKQITNPTAECLSLKQAKTHLSIGHDDDDANITDDIQAARALCEEYTGRYFGSRSFRLTMKSWPTCEGDYAIRLPIEPVASVTTVKYSDQNAASQTVDQSQYRLWLDHSPPVIYFPASFRFPSLDINSPAPIEVIFVAGDDDIPAVLRKAIQLTLGFWLQFPGGEPTLGHLSRGLPGGVLALLDTLWTGAQ